METEPIVNNEVVEDVIETTATGVEEVQKPSYIEIKRINPNKEVTNNEDLEGMVLLLQNETTGFNQDMHRAFIATVDAANMPDGVTTVVSVKLKNGYIMSESSSCIPGEEFNQDVLVERAMFRIYNRIKECLTFLFFCGKISVKEVKTLGIKVETVTEEAPPMS